MGLGLRKIINQINVRLDLAGFEIRNGVLGFDQANAFLRRVGKNSIIPLLKKNGAVIGSNCDIEVPLIFHNCYDFKNFKIGNNVHIGKNCFFDLRDKITIEDNVVISMQTTFITHFDLSKSGLSIEYPAAQKPVLIKNDSYIGANVTILMGVTMGNYSMAAAGAVVNCDVLPWTVVGGVPAKEIKKLKMGK
ncbi:MAG: acyltransferase [Thermodesulfovibrionales bacterium]|nr:acyltransferase [Thermodesulfovibrionales bacterium]